MVTNHSFSRRGPDRVTEELAAVLSANTSFEFKPLFLLVHDNLKARSAAGGGEEMLRLRAYEKLQSLVQRGMVEKKGKSYKGKPAGLAALKLQIAEQHCADLVRAARKASPEGASEN